MPSDTGEITALLEAWSDGDAKALDSLMVVVQEELRTIAGRLFQGERLGHTLQPTALVNELYLKLAQQRQVQWQHRTHFFAVAARFMRRLLVDHARKRMAAKRGGGQVRVLLEGDLGLPGATASDILALDHALFDLSRRWERQARIVELYLLVGLTLEEIATIEHVSRKTVAREWRTARLFLLRQLST